MYVCFQRSYVGWEKERGIVQVSSSCLGETGCMLIKCRISAFLQETEETEMEKPAKRKVRARRMPFDPKAEPGAMEPLGYFDPLGICPPGILASWLYQIFLKRILG